MNLPAPAQWAASDALANVLIEAEPLRTPQDTAAAKRALLAVRHAAMRAYGIITEAERETREAAIAQHESRAA